MLNFSKQFQKIFSFIELNNLLNYSIVSDHFATFCSFFGNILYNFNNFFADVQTIGIWKMYLQTYMKAFISFTEHLHFQLVTSDND